MTCSRATAARYEPNRGERCIDAGEKLACRRHDNRNIPRARVRAQGGKQAEIVQPRRHHVGHDQISRVCAARRVSPRHRT
jgi:hypothetical protein